MAIRKAQECWIHQMTQKYKDFIAQRLNYSETIAQWQNCSGIVAQGQNCSEFKKNKI